MDVGFEVSLSVSDIRATLISVGSYDDGPSPDTPRLLDYLSQQNLKSTFFIVGSRAISRQDILQAEFMLGHQLSVHTWSHPSLTTLTNEQVIAELGWTAKIIKEVTGSVFHKLLVLCD